MPFAARLGTQGLLYQVPRRLSNPVGGTVPWTPDRPPVSCARTTSFEDRDLGDRPGPRSSGGLPTRGRFRCPFTVRTPAGRCSCAARIPTIEPARPRAGPEHGASIDGPLDPSTRRPSRGEPLVARSRRIDNGKRPACYNAAGGTEPLQPVVRRDPRLQRAAHAPRDSGSRPGG